MNKKTLFSIFVIFLFIVSYKFWSEGFIDPYVPSFLRSDYWSYYNYRNEKKLEQSLDTNCGIENCHGLDIACGPNPAEVCTMVYQLGDKCRRFAQCGIVNGSCQQIQNQDFEDCKACVQRCEAEFGDFADKLFECESRC